jgi:hypothetical protein
VPLARVRGRLPFQFLGKEEQGRQISPRANRFTAHEIEAERPRDQQSPRGQLRVRDLGRRGSHLQVLRNERQISD